MTDTKNIDYKTENQKKSNSMEIEFKDIFNFLRDYRSPFLKITSLTLLIAFFYSAFARKTWEGYTKIVLTNPDSPRSLLSGINKTDVTAAIGINNVSKLNTEVEILKSPSVLLPVFEFVKREKEKDREKIKSKDFFDWYSKNFYVELQRGTTILKLSYKDTNKERIKKVLEKTIKEYQEFPQRNKINATDREIEYLEKQSLIQKAIAKNASEELQKYVLTNNLSLPINFEELGFVSPFTIKSKIENELLKTKYSKNKFKEVKFDNQKLFIFASSLVGSTPTIIEISKIDSDLILNGEKYTKNDISTSGLKKRRLKLFDILRTNIENYLDQRLEKINTDKLITDNWSENVLIEYSEYSRNVIREEAVLNDIESKLRLSKIQKARSASPWELITKPTIKPRPVWPVRKLILMPAALVTGLFLSLIYIFIKEKDFRDYL